MQCWPIVESVVLMDHLSHKGWGDHHSTHVVFMPLLADDILKFLVRHEILGSKKGGKEGFVDIFLVLSNLAVECLHMLIADFDVIMNINDVCRKLHDLSTEFHHGASVLDC